jgi:hypothetical protein
MAAQAQDPATTAPAAAASEEELGKKLSNPISDLVSIPFQFNWQNGVGPNSDLQFLLNVQPVVPFHLSKCWNLILISKLTWLGPFPFSIQAGAGYYAVHPDIGPKWRMQLAFIVLLPSKK